MLFDDCGGSLGILQLCLFSDITQCALYIVFVLCPLQLCCLMIVLRLGGVGLGGVTIGPTNDHRIRNISNRRHFLVFYS